MVSAIASASAYSGRSEKPVQRRQHVAAAEAQRAEALAARRQVHDLAPLARVLGADLQRAAHDLPVERAGQAAVAGQHDDADALGLTPRRAAAPPARCAREAASIIRSRMRSAYGRRASMRSWARRSFEAETSSSAFVILRVLRTDEIRRLMSCWLATR